MWEKNIVNLLNSMVYDRSYYEIVSDFFELSAIAIRNMVDLRPPLRQEYEERYLQMAKHYNYLTAFVGLMVLRGEKVLDSEDV